jgi:hypothetical protein
MAKLNSSRKFIQTVTRTVRGEEFYFHIFTDAHMIHVLGRGDKQSTGKPGGNSNADLIINDLISTVLARGNVAPGAWEVA